MSSRHILLSLTFFCSTTFGASSLIMDEKPDDSAFADGAVSASAAVTSTSKATPSTEIRKTTELCRITLARTALLSKLKKETSLYKLKSENAIGNTTKKGIVITPILAARLTAKKYHQLINTPELSFFKPSTPYSSEASDRYITTLELEIDATIARYRALSKKAQTKLERLVTQKRITEAGAIAEPIAAEAAAIPYPTIGTPTSVATDAPTPDANIQAEPEGIWWFIRTISLGYI